MTAHIMFLLSSYKSSNTGVGGHYRSIKTISNELTKENKTSVFTYGDLPSPVLNELNYYTHIEADKTTRYASLVKLREHIKDCKKKSDDFFIVSVGGFLSYITACLASLGLSVKIFHLKPGGEALNETRKFNRIPMVFFHKQDEEKFQMSGYPCLSHVVKGRVEAPEKDSVLLESFKEDFFKQKSDKRIVALYVCRMSGDKLIPLSIVYDVLERMKIKPVNNKPEISIFHVGVSQDEEVEKNFSKKAKANNISYISSDKYCKDAAKLTHLADFSIGIGRTALESMSIGKPIFIPVNVDDRSELVLVTKDNYAIFSKHNFTYRAPPEELRASGDIVYLENYLNSSVDIELHSQEMKNIYEENFSVKAGAEELVKFLMANNKKRLGQRLWDAYRIYTWLSPGLKRKVTSILRV